MRSIILTTYYIVSASMKLAFLYSQIKPDFLLPAISSDSYTQVIIDQHDLSLNKILDEEVNVFYDLTYSLIMSKEIQSMLEGRDSYYINGFSSDSPLFLANILKKENLIMMNLFSELNITQWSVYYLVSYYQDYRELIDKSTFRTAVQGISDIMHLNRSTADLKYTEISTIILILPPNIVISYFHLNPLKNFYYILLDFCDILSFSPTLSPGYSILKLSRMNSSSFLSQFLDYFSNCSSLDFWVCYRSFPSDSWKILNYYNKSYEVMGYCNETCYLNKQINSTLNLIDLSTSKKEFVVSYDSSTHDPQDNSLFNLIPVFHGVDLGIDYTSNLSNIFQIIGKKEILGGSYYNKSFVDAAIEKDPKFGNVMIAPCMSALAIGVYQTLRNNSLDMPMIGYSNTVSDLSVTTDFPLYARLCMPDPYVTLVLSLMFRYFGWVRIGVLYVDNIYSRSLYQEFKEFAKNYGLVILNDGNNMLPRDNSKWKGPEFDSILNNLGESSARIILVISFIEEITPILIRMYELGYYGQDYEYISVSWLVDQIINPSPPYNSTALDIVRNSLKGSLMFFPVYFIDTFGAHILDLYKKTYNSEPIGYTSFAFDAVYAVYQNFEYLINSKKDYENPQVFMNYFRKLKFTGTTGPVTFQQSNNDRSPMDHYVFNLQVNNGVWDIVNVGIFTPSGYQVFNFTKNITWPGDKIPSDRPTRYFCGFSPDQVTVNKVNAGMLIGFLVFTILNICYIMKLGWAKWGTIAEIGEANEKLELTFMDIMNIMKIFLDFLQYIGMVPSIPITNSLFVMIKSSISLEFGSVYLNNSNFFWITYYIVLSSVSIGIALRLLKYFGTQIVYSVAFFFFISDIMFMPILSTLVNVYQCQYSYKFAFLYYDCKVVCWNYPYFIIFIFNSIVLVFFVTVFAYERPIYSSGYYLDQNVCISSANTYLKSFVQSLIILLSKIIWLIEPTGFYVGSMIILSIFITNLWFSPPYNLKLLNIMNFSVYIILLFTYLISFLYQVSSATKNDAFLVVLLCGWALITLCCTIVIKSRESKWPFVGGFKLGMLKFAFTIKKSAETKNSDTVMKTENIEAGKTQQTRIFPRLSIK